VAPPWVLGPAIQTEVGDTIVVHFKNKTPFPASMHPHDVRYAKDSEGTPYGDGTSGKDKADDAVRPGKTHTYVWQVPERAGPGPGDASSTMWMYHSHTDEVADTYAGLIGPIIVTKRGMANPDGSPKDVDRQFVALFEVAHENQSPYLRRNIRRYARLPRRAGKRPSRRKQVKRELGELPEQEEFGESNLMHSINGYVYGNGPLFEMKRGERVRWYVMGMGTEVDLHSPHWHGNTITTSTGMRTDTVPLMPATMVQGDMVPRRPGDLAVPLPRQRPHPRGHARPLQGRLTRPQATLHPSLSELRDEHRAAPADHLSRRQRRGTASWHRFVLSGAANAPACPRIICFARFHAESTAPNAPEREQGLRRRPNSLSRL
jgi:FtsP/CotA-like multicopper oxidase with cupredoxin domain